MTVRIDHGTEQCGRTVAAMDIGEPTTTLEWMIEPLNEGALAPVVVERAAPAHLYFEIVAVDEHLEGELVITI